MKHIAFALKWRPQDFDEVVGQEHITTTLKNAIKQDRIAHAFLFAGPRGTGKTSTARILAKALNCKKGPTPTPCNKCQSCQSISQANSLDVIEIDGASNNSVDEVRVLRENVKLAPASGRYKIYIIDEVHMLSIAAFNALLKTLEEPPAHVKFIFATTQPRKLPATIISRCQRFDFRKIPTEEILEKLKQIVKAEKIKADDEALFSIAHASDGALRDAEGLIEQIASFTDKKISLDDVNSVLGAVGVRVIIELTQMIINKDTPGSLKLLDELVKGGHDLDVFLSEFIEYVRNLLVAKETGGKRELLDVADDTFKEINRQKDLFKKEELLYIFSLLSNIKQNLYKYRLGRIPIEMALIKLTGHESLVDVGKLLDELDKLKKQTPPSSSSAPDASSGSSGPSPAKPAQSKTKSSSSAIAVASIDGFHEVWDSACRRIRDEKTSVGLFISEGEPLHFKGNILTIGFYPGFKFHRESLEHGKNKELVERILSQMLDREIKVKYEDVEGKRATEPKDKPQKEAAQEKAPSEEDDKANSIVSSAIKLFGGLVVNKDKRDYSN